MLQWEISEGEVDYDTALEKMDNHVQKMISGETDEKIWLLEHPSLYTAGTSANKRTSLSQIDFLSLKRNVVVNIRIMGPASELFM